MRVFVLTTGRSGSTTFAAACSHLENFTSGHETRWNADPEDRLSYPDRHIEVDNRLAWFLGTLDNLYPAARYVHLVRDPHAVARSFERRWNADPPRKPTTGVKSITTRLKRQRNPRVSAMSMFAYPMFGRRDPWPITLRPKLAQMLVHTMNDNIAHYLSNKPHMTIDLAAAANEFPRFCSWIEAEGDIDAAVEEFGVLHNRWE
jgi:hypothetical protein